MTEPIAVTHWYVETDHGPQYSHYTNGYDPEEKYPSCLPPHYQLWFLQKPINVQKERWTAAKGKLYEDGVTTEGELTDEQWETLTIVCMCGGPPRSAKLPCPKCGSTARR